LKELEMILIKVLFRKAYHEFLMAKELKSPSWHQTSQACNLRPTSNETSMLRKSECVIPSKVQLFL